MNTFQRLLSPQLQRRYRDIAPRGNGNRAARRAIRTPAGREFAACPANNVSPLTRLMSWGLVLEHH